MKIVLGPSAIKALIADQPEMAELGKYAAQQVAEAVTRKLTKEYIEQQIGRLMSDHMTSGFNYRPVMTPVAEKMLNTYLTKRGDELLVRLETKMFTDAIREQFVAFVQQERVRIRVELTDNIDKLLRERFAAMFGAPA